MSRTRFHLLLSFMVGAVAFLFLQLHFTLSWSTYYSHFPFRGHETAMAQGYVPPFFSTSTRSLLITIVVLVLLPFCTLWFARGQLMEAGLALLALWGGVMLTVVLIWITTPRLREDNNMWPIDFVILAFLTGVPVLVGGVGVFVVQKFILWNRHRQ